MSYRTSDVAGWRRGIVGAVAAAAVAFSGAPAAAEGEALTALARGALEGGLDAARDGAVRLDEVLVTRSDDPLRIYVSLDDQRIDVYRGFELVDSAPISSGRAGHSTPLGVFSILDKRRFHRSNLYDDAPMPFMQRLTWSGIALHAGRLPGYPASHGCVRLPTRFAEWLFGQTDIGVDVVISGPRVAPQMIAHPTLFQPTPTMRLAALADGPPSDLEFALSVAAEQATFSDEPLRILITRSTLREDIIEAQIMLAMLGYEPGPADGIFGRGTARAARAFQSDAGMAASGVLSPEFMAALYEQTGRTPHAGRIYIRQGYEDIYDAPVAIDDPETPLGMHVYATMAFDDGDHATIWSGVTIDDEADATAMDALGRVTLEPETRAWIEARLTPGSTLIIADEGRGRETGPGTDFIVEPR